MTISSCTAAARSDVLRLIRVRPSILCSCGSVIGNPHAEDSGAPSVQPSCIAPFNPANEVADVNGAAQSQTVITPAFFGGVGIGRPVADQALQTREIDQAASDRRCFKSIKITTDAGPPLSETAEPGCALYAAATLVQYLRRQPVRKDRTSERAAHAVAPEHRFGHCERKLQQPAIRVGISYFEAVNFATHAAQVTCELIMIEQEAGTMCRRIPPILAKSGIEALEAPRLEETFGGKGRIERAVTLDAVNRSPA